MGGHAPTDQMNPEERAARDRNSLAIHSFSAVHRIASSRYMNASPRAHNYFLAAHIRADSDARPVGQAHCRGRQIARVFGAIC